MIHIKECRGQMNLPTDEQLLKNVQEFIRKDEYQIWNEIKDFVNKHSIRHVIIADMTKIIPESISKYLRVYPSYISSRAKLRLYTWYEICKDQPGMITRWYPKWAAGTEKLKPFGPGRKLKFVYRTEHLAVLQQYFKINPYPNKELKEEIANECNKAVESTGISLSYGEKVNPYMVNSWFGNKRRETKSLKIKV